MIRLAALGDVVRTLPAVSSLRAAHPGAHIAWLVESAASGAVAEQPWVDEVIVFPRERLIGALGRLRPTVLREARSFVRRLRARRFDWVVDFHSILRSGVLSLLSGAPRRVAYAPPFGREAAHWFATITKRF